MMRTSQKRGIFILFLMFFLSLYILPIGYVFAQDIWEKPYEPNDTPEDAYPIVIGFKQEHTFHETNDADWVYFYARKGERYEIKAYDPIKGYWTRIILCDADGIMIPQKDDFINPSFKYKYWQCTRNGYYTLMVESANDILFSYFLSVDRREGADPTADIQGRVVDPNNKGINGLDVYAQTDVYTWETSTGSIKNVRKPAAYQTINPEIETEGWFFMENLLAPGTYKIMVTAKDDPNTILAEIGNTYLYENDIHRINDIVIVRDLLPSHHDPNKEAVKGFEWAYTRSQEILREQYIPWEDTDNDGFLNMEEFLIGTEPSDPSHPTVAYNLNPGLNLFPFLLNQFWASDFYFERLEECHSIWGYNKEEKIWYYCYKDSVETDFLLEKGKGYLVYWQTPDMIYQDAKNSITFLTPGINLTTISPIPERDENTPYTSFQFLRDRKTEGVKSISRFRNDQGKENKSKGIWETSYQFFIRPAGVEFPILPNEAYSINVKR